jgi:hypothetical protein
MPQTVLALRLWFSTIFKTSASTLLQDKLSRRYCLHFQSGDSRVHFRRNFINLLTTSNQVPGLNGVVQELQLAQVSWNWPEQYNIYKMGALV